MTVPLQSTLERIDVDVARSARMTLRSPADKRTEAIVEHFDDKQLLARERRPFIPGERTIDIKSHPNATHLACSLARKGRALAPRAFHLELGDPIQPVGKHFVVVGAMKAGTTTLFRLLEQHPAICRTWAETPGSSFTKEINYFTHLFEPGDSALHYDWRFPFDPSMHAWTLDVSPNYAKLKESRPVGPRMAALGAELKLAYILREPVDRIESHIAHMLRQHGRKPGMRHCIRVSRYGWHLDNFRLHIPMENILLLDFFELKSDPQSVVSRICAFLDIEPVSPRTGVFNRRRVRYNLDPSERMALADALRPDVQRVIDEYGFDPARHWLKAPERSWSWPSILRQ